jgi:hypothetical protein
MKKIIKKYNGVILLYLVIIVGVFVMNARYKYLNEIEVERDSAVATLMGN